MQRPKRLLGHLHLEQLEARSMAGVVFQPTDTEQLFLELLNLARANPAAYGESIDLDLTGVAPSQPLAFNLDLIESARLHSQDMHDRDFFDHVNPDGLDAGDRIDATGYAWYAWAESIAAGYPTPAEALEALIVDFGVDDLGHRKHLLAMDALSASLPEVGIGIFRGAGAAYEDYYTIDGARDYPSSTANPSRFLTGVAYQDLDSNNFYSPGEGISGVTVSAARFLSTYSTTTLASGGYSLELPSGTYTVTASGGGLSAAQTVTVTVGAGNVKQDFEPTAPAPPVARLGVWSVDWKLDTNANQTWDGADRDVAKFGNVNRDVPVAIDWDNDGADELAYFRFGYKLIVDVNESGTWDKRPTDAKIILTSRCEPLGDHCDQLIVGDWNADGRDDFGVLHRATGVFQLDSNGDRALTGSDTQFEFVPLQSGDTAVAGDWNGDGSSEVGIFRQESAGQASFLLDLNGNGQWDSPAVDRQVDLGVLPSGTRPAPANFDSDPRTELAVFSGDTFRVAYNNYSSVLTTLPFTAGLRPVVGDWS